MNVYLKNQKAFYFYLYLYLWLAAEDDAFQTVGRGWQQLLSFRAAIVVGLSAVLRLLQILFDPKHQSETCYISSIFI